MKISYRTPSFIKKFIHHYGILSVHHRRNIAAPYHPWLNVICRPKRNRGVIFLNQINQHRNTLTQLDWKEMNYFWQRWILQAQKPKARWRYPAYLQQLVFFQLQQWTERGTMPFDVCKRMPRTVGKTWSNKGRNVSMKES